MKALRKPVYFACGNYTVSLGSGRKEFHPKKPRPSIEDYIAESGQATIAQMEDPEALDEGFIGNFMAGRFIHQGHLGAMLALVHPGYAYKPSMRVEGACASGGLAVAGAIKAVLADQSDVVLALGAEIQNTVKAIYGADILAGAGHYSAERKNGHAYFFPSKFSDRAGAYKERFGFDRAWAGMGRWYEQAVQNARANSRAQEFHNQLADPFAAHQAMAPNPRAFCEHINYLDCSKVSDGAASLVVCSEEGLKNAGIAKKDAVQLCGLGHAVADLTAPPDDQTVLTTTGLAARRAMEMAGITPDQVGIFEIHDCFTITGLLTVEAVGLAGHGEGADFVAEGHTRRDGASPMNASGGLVGYGHPTGASGVRMNVDVLHQLTGKSGDYQVDTSNKPYGLSISMGGNDKTVVSCVLRRAE